VEDFYSLVYDDSTCRIVYKKGHKFLSYGSINLIPGVVVNGKIENPVSFAKSLTQLKINVVGKIITTQTVVVALPEEKVFIQIIEIPIVEESKIPEVVKWQADKLISFNMDSVYLDYQVIRSEDKTKLKVLVTAAYKDVVDSLLKALDLAGQHVKAIESCSGSLARLFTQKENELSLILECIGNKVTIIVAKNYIARLSTISNIGHKQAEIESKAKEITHFYTTRKDTLRKFTKLIVLGDSRFNFNKLASDLGMKIDVPKLNHLLDKKKSKLVNEYIPNLGLYTKTDLGVNILPPDLKLQASKRHLFLKISESLNLTLILTIFTLCCGLIFLMWLNINRINTQGVIDSKSKIRISPKLSQVQENVIDLNDRLATIDVLNTSDQTGYNMLNQIIDNLPAKADINEVKFDLTLKTLVIDGIISNREDLINYQKTLLKIPQIANVDLPLRNFEQDTNIPFEIDVKLK
jgi:hypothetical protein